MNDLGSMLTEKGFMSLFTDLCVSGISSSSEMLNVYSKGLFTCPALGLESHCTLELRANVQYAMTPFAPVFISRSAACLVTQKYISSYPASGLVLISPPISNADLVGDKLPSELEEFIYEPKFPIAIIDTTERIQELKEKNRLCKEPNPFVDIIAVEKLEGQPLFSAVEKWLDELGV